MTNTGHFAHYNRGENKIPMQSVVLLGGMQAPLIAKGVSRVALDAIWLAIGRQCSIAKPAPAINPFIIAHVIASRMCANMR
jgi:hypothetical protein